MKRFLFSLMVTLVAVCANAAAPNSSGTYYQNANGKKGAALKTALCGIIYNRTEQTYKSLWTAFKTTDVRSDGKIWDMYSDNTNYVPGGSAQGANYSAEGDSYNREHSFPQSWFGSNDPMYTDLHHIYPTDGFVNSKRSNYPFGETNGTGQGSYQSNDGFSKLGKCTYSGYSSTVFEPADEYKGDFARTYFYMITCYEEKLHDWYTNYSSTEVTAVIDGSSYPGFQTWQLNMLLAWAAADPVSDKETARNNAVYGIQGNRNPFIDYPGLEQYIWGSKTNDAFSYNDYVEPEGYSSGSGTGGGSGTNTEGTTITISYADIPDGYTATTGTSGSITKTVSTTSDLSVAYSGINTKSSTTASDHAYGYAMFLKNYGYIYNTSAPDGYYPSKVTATFSSSTGTSGKVGINYGTSAITSRNSSVTGSVTQSGTYETSNTDETKLYWNFSTTDANVQVTKIEVIYSPVTPSLADPTTYSTPTSTSYNGASFTLVNGTHFTTDGQVTLHSDNEAVATVNGLTVKPVAVGECFINVTYGQGSTYKASNSVFKFTVTAPEGGTTAYTPKETTATLSFASNDAWKLPTAYTTDAASYSNGTYTISLTAGTAGDGWKWLTDATNGNCLIMGKTNVTLTFPAFDKAVTQIDVVGKSGASTSVIQNIYVGSTAVSTATTGATGTNEYAIKENYQAAGNVYTLKVTSNHNTQITSIVVHFTSTPLTVTLNASGYATYCSEYPLDFSSASDYTAWQITGVSGSTITFEQVTGAVKGGTGLLLKGEAHATITLASVASSNTLSSNLLYGTLAPTYAATGDYYGLSGNEFVKVNAGTVPAGKALLPASLVDGDEVKSFTFCFEDTTTGIMDNGQLTMDNDHIFNLAGQRMGNGQLKRGLYIVNGKKVVVK